jgi:uncharacterized protein YfaS (alpha-2-macroglobulin family)
MRRSRRFSRVDAGQCASRLVAAVRLVSLSLLACSAVLAGTARADLDLPLLARSAETYRASLQASPGAVDVDAVALLAAIKAAERSGDSAEMIRHLEALAGARGDSFDIAYRLAATISRFAGDTPKALSSAFLAYRAAKERSDRLSALRLLGTAATQRMETLARERKELMDRHIHHKNAEDSGPYGADVAFPRPDPRDTLPETAPRRLDGGTAGGAIARALAEIESRIAALDAQHVETLRIAHKSYLELFRELELPLDERLPPWDELAVKLRTLFKANEPVSATVNWRGGAESLSACVLFDTPLDVDPKLDRKSHVEVLRHAATAGVDAGKAVTFDLRVEQRSLCLIGLEHGGQYEVKLRKGLPLTASAALARDHLFTGATAPDLPPLVRFKGQSYVVPSRGDKAIELQAVNIQRVPLELVRIPDRAIHRQIPLGLEQGDPGSKTIEELYRNASDPVWSGELVIDGKPDNRLHTLRLPVHRLLDERRRWIRAPEAADKTLGSAGGVFEAGRFYRDPVSHEAAGMRLDEPGVYALIAKLPTSTSEQKRADTTPRIDPDGDIGPRTADESDAEAVGPAQPAEPSYGTTTYPRQWLVFTDIGLTYWRSSEKLYVVARSLAGGGAVAGADIQLVARNNRVLAQGRTDARGVVEFAGRLAGGSHGNRLAAILAFKGQDFSFIDVVRGGLDLSRLDVGGRAPPGEIDAFVYTDRGVYRPSAPDASGDRAERVNALVLVRDGAGNSVPLTGPLRVRLRSLHGPTLGEQVIDAATVETQAGGHMFHLDIPATMPFGSAVVEAFVGQSPQAIGRAEIQIAHIKPDRARLLFDAPEKWTSRIGADGAYALDGSATAQYLTAAIGAGGEALDVIADKLSGDVEVVIERAEQPFGGCHADFAFGVAGDGFSPFLIRSALAPSDRKGRLRLSAAAASLPPSQSPLAARVTVNVQDAGGMVASRTVKIPVQRDADWIGIRRVTSREEGNGKFTLEASALVVDGKGQPRGAVAVGYRLYREQPEYLWFRDAENWSYRSEVSLVPVSGFVGTAVSTPLATDACNTANVTLAPVSLPHGDYVLELTAADGMRARQRFSLGAASAGLDRPEPGLLKIRTAKRDRAEYTTGETAAFGIEAPFQGQVLAAVVSAGSVVGWYETETKPSAAGGNAFTAEIEVPVAASWRGQLHLVATVFRASADGSIARGPQRAIGVLPFAVDIADRKLAMALTGTPHRVTPASGVPMVRITAGPKLEGEAWVALFAVDEGLLNLTEHQPPDPLRHFYGTRRLQFDIHDSYSRLLLTADPGGDDGYRLLSRLIFNNYLSQRIVAATEMRKATFKKGVATIERPDWNLERFAGTVQIVAVVWTREWMSVARHQTLVRDALLADLGMPRFLAPGDKPEIPLTFENVEAMDDEYEIELTGREARKVLLPGATEWIDLEQAGNRFALKLPRGERKTVFVQLELDTDDLRESKLTLKAELRGKRADNPARLAWEWSPMVRLPLPSSVRLVASSEVRPQATAKLQVPADAIAALRRARLQVRFTAQGLPLPLRPQVSAMADTPAMLNRLVWSGMQLVGDDRAEARAMLERTLGGIVSLQRGNGHFDSYKQQVISRGAQISAGARPAHISVDEQLWDGALALDLLREAKAQGFVVASALDKATTHLRRLARDSLKRLELARDDVAISLPATLDGSASGQLGATLGELPAEMATALQLAAGSAALVGAVEPGGAAARGGLAAGDVILTVDGFAAGAAWRVEEVIGKRPAGSAVRLGVLRNGARTDLAVTLDPRKPAPAAATEAESDEAPADARTGGKCDRGLAYAVAVLVRLDAVALADIEGLHRICAGASIDEPSAVLPLLIAASAFKEFGKPELAAAQLDTVRSKLVVAAAEIEPSAGADPSLESAMLMLFLRRIEPAAPELAELVAGFPQTLTPAAQAWLARLSREAAGEARIALEMLPAKLADGDVVEVREPATVSTRFLKPRDFTESGLSVRNDGSTAIKASIFAEGLESIAPQAPQQRVRFTRRFVALDGASLGEGDLTVRQNQMFAVVIEGSVLEHHKATDPADNGERELKSRLVVIDLLPAGVEIVSPRILPPDGVEEDADARSRAAGTDPLQPLGEVVYNEARDDKYVAIIEPSKSEFRAVYVVRASVPGTYRIPAVRVEDLRRPEIGVFDAGTRTLRVERGAAMP